MCAQVRPGIAQAVRQLSGHRVHQSIFAARRTSRLSGGWRAKQPAHRCRGPPRPALDHRVETALQLGEAPAERGILLLQQRAKGVSQQFLTALRGERRKREQVKTDNLPLAVRRAENPEIWNGKGCVQKFNRFRGAGGLWKNRRVGCHSQELVDDIFGHKTGIARLASIRITMRAKGVSQWVSQEWR